jgi:Kef-type K+ transport system membrane component KefB
MRLLHNRARAGDRSGALRARPGSRRGEHRRAPPREWLDFIASFASIGLAFLAGFEVDPGSFRERFTPSVAIGLVSVIGPFVVGSLVALGLLDWTLKASLIAGTALSTTSLAVIYAVLVEDGLSETELGKRC